MPAIFHLRENILSRQQTNKEMRSRKLKDSSKAFLFFPLVTESCCFLCCRLHYLQNQLALIPPFYDASNENQ